MSTPAERRRAREHNRLAMFRRHRARTAEQLLRAALRAQATSEAVVAANEQLEEMGLFDVQITDEYVGTVQNILRAEVAAVLAQGAYLPKGAKYDIVDRIVARVFPTALSRVSDPGEIVRRTESLESAIAREAAKLRGK